MDKDCFSAPPCVVVSGGFHVEVSAVTVVAVDSLPFKDITADAVDEVGRRASSPSSEERFSCDRDRDDDSFGDSCEGVKLLPAAVASA